jgi:hypothetical protein
MNAVATPRSVAQAQAKGLAAETSLPPVASVRATSDISYTELRSIARTLQKLGELAGDKALLAEYPVLTRDLTETLAQYPSIVRAHLQTGMKRLALNNAARIRGDVDANPEKLLRRAERIKATVEALQQNVAGWDIDPILHKMFSFHLKSLSQDLAGVRSPERLAR